MIGTIETKEQQLTKGYFEIGSGATKVLILGSCRAVGYITYFADLNKRNNEYTIYYVDPFNWNWNKRNERIDYEAKLLEMETNNDLLELFKSIDIFIHEYYANAGMFNVMKEAEKNIYQFGMNPKHDITLPNYNDIFLMTAEIVAFMPEIRKEALQDYNVLGFLSDELQAKIKAIKEENLNKFISICKKTTFPEFADLFLAEYKKVRYFWTFNHVAKKYTQELFVMICQKLNIDLTKYNISDKDLWNHHYTSVTEYDREFEFNEPTKQLRSLL